MPKNTDVFDIMIEKEQEAIAFYTKMLEIARFDAFKTTISEFIKMEENHVVIIQGFKEHGFKDRQIKDFKSLGLSSSSDKAEPIDASSFESILHQAVQREDAAFNLYSQLKEDMAGTEYEKIFALMAKEEAAHKYYFEKLYDDHILKDN
jgi:rubrerythrin